MPTTDINILILCENEHSAQLDRRSLRECGFGQSRILNSGIKAAQLLARMKEEEEKIDLVICHERLADMRFDQFCAIIRSHPALKTFPILLIPSNPQEAGMALSDREYTDLLVRPFSIDSLKKKLLSLILKAREAKKEAGENIPQDDSAFIKALDSYGLLLRQDRSPDDYFHMGMDFLKEQNWSLAISAFQKSIQDHRLKAEAELGMAAAYKGHNDLLNFRQALASAAESFVKSGRWNRGRNAYARLLQHDKSAKNPFFVEAHRYVRRGAYSKAAQILQESLPLLPKGLAGAKLAQLCFIAEDPDAMLAALITALPKDGMEILKVEITTKLQSLQREKEERERQKNAERKWELKRNLEKKRSEEEKTNPAILAAKPELREENAKIAFLEDEDSEVEDLEENEENGENFTKPQILAPLTRPEATTDLFGKKPKFNEFLSVVKLTWKLARRSNKDKRDS